MKLSYSKIGLSCALPVLIFGESVLGFSVSSLSASTTRIATTQLQMACWSDSKAVMDYQNFLSSGKQEIERKADGPSVIIVPSGSSNDMAHALLTMGMGDDIVLTKGDLLPAEIGGSPEYPIYICLPPTEIEDFLRNLSDNFKQHNEDFVFFSGGPYFGNIEDVLKSVGYCRDTMTQVLVSGLEVSGPARIIKDVSVKLGTDAVGEEKLAGECAACGKWNGAIGKRMERSDVRCSVDFYRDWRRKMWERNVLDAVFNLVGAVREEPTSVKDVANYYDEEVSDMAWEVSGSLRGWKAVTLMFGFEERLFGVAENSSPEAACSLDESMYPFILGSRVFEDSPMINEYLWFAKENCGLLSSVELPPKRAKDGKSIMRKGNLRADGVL
jgi:hypothetical protein